MPPPVTPSPRPRCPAPITPRCSGRPTGDRLRLADTELIIEVEQDYTVYGDEMQIRRR